MKKIIKVLEKVLFFTVALFCFSCKNEFVEENTSLVKISINPVIKEMQEGISPNISSSVLPGRNIYPDFETDSTNLKFVLTGSKDGDSPKEIGRWDSLNQLQNSDILIEPGIWNLTLSASNGWPFEDSRLCYQAVTEVEITDSTEIKFIMSTVENCQIQGSFSFEIYYPSDNGWSVTANLLTAAYEPTAYSFNLDSYSYYSHAYINLVPGVYVLQLKFVNKQSQSEEISTTYKNIVFTILPVLTTRYNKTYTSDELNKQYQIYYENCDPSYENYDQLPKSFKLMQKVIIPPLVRQNYIFNGWYYYDGSSGSNIYLEKIEDGNYVFVTTEANSNNLNFYADWILNGDQDSNGFGWTLENGVLTLYGEGFYPYSINDYPSWKTATSLVIEEGITGFTTNPYTGSGYIGFYNQNYETIALKSVILPSTFQEICSDCFYCCYELEEITLPERITSIGSYAFYKCTSLEEIELPEAVTEIGNCAFDGCTSLKTINMPGSLTYIGAYAFRNCAVTSITVPDSVQTVYQSAFRGWKPNQEINLQWTSLDTTHSAPVSDSYYYGTYAKYRDPVYAWDGWIPDDDGVLHITGTGSKALYNSGLNYYYNSEVRDISSYEFPSNITSIVVDDGITSLAYSSVDTYIPNVTSISLPSTLASIDRYVFANFSGITEITIPESVTYIGDCAFYNCTSLGSISIPSGVTSISSYTFAGCSSLESVVLPDTVTAIGTYAFENCTSLGSISIPSGVTLISSFTFNGCTSLESIELPDTVTSIGEYAFENCTSLVSISIPEGITEINNGMFYNCTSLETVVLPSTLKTIGKNCFYNCSKLTTIELPFGLKTIADYAFYKCSSVPEITIPATVTSIGSCAFDYWTDSQTIYLAWPSSDIISRTIPELAFGYEGVIVVNDPSSTLGLGTLTLTVFENGTYPFIENDGIWSSTNQLTDSSSSETTWCITVEQEKEYVIGYSVSSEINYDKLNIYLDDGVVFEVSGEDSGIIPLTLTAGTHKIKAVYTKDSGGAVGTDTATIIFY